MLLSSSTVWILVQNRNGRQSFETDDLERSRATWGLARARVGGSDVEERPARLCSPWGDRCRGSFDPGEDGVDLRGQPPPEWRAGEPCQVVGIDLSDASHGLPCVSAKVEDGSA